MDDNKIRKTITCHILNDGFVGLISKGKKFHRYITVSIDGSEVRLPITAEMEKEVYNTSKVKLTIEII